MTAYIIVFILGALVASTGWWIKVRSLNGVVSDLQNVSSDAKAAAAKVTTTVKSA